MVVAVVLAACGDGSDPTTTGEGSGPDASSTTTGEGSVPDASSTTSAETSDEIAPGEGRAVRIMGVVTDGAICPGGQRPCLPLTGEVEPDADGAVIVTGRLLDGAVVVHAHEQPSSRPSLRDDECGPEVSPDDSDAVRTTLADHIAASPDEFAINWISATGTLHLGVVGDAAPHVAALTELGVADHVCVVGGFERSRQELDEVLSGAAELLIERQADGGPAFYGGTTDVFASVARVDVERVDRPLLDAVQERFGDLVELQAPITVLDGTFADLDAALARVEPDDGVDLDVTCGAARFDELPPDPDEFAPLDDDAQGALDRAATGRAAEEFVFLPETEWRIADRTAERLVLFGVPVDDATDGEFLTATFTRFDDGWDIDGFGGCRIQVSAIGLGPASVELDPARPPDPASTELPVLINERECADGEAPIGREIVPIVVETETSVEVTVLVAPVPGGATCPSNPWHPIVVELDAPWADRTLLDGSTRPPVERPWPPTNPELVG